jgi:hypothetical protein
MSSPVRRTGVLVIRAWLEEDSSRELRVRVIRTLDVDDPHPREVVSMLARVEDVAALVGTWLTEFVNQHSPGPSAN